jgi:gluconokinase
MPSHLNQGMNQLVVMGVAGSGKSSLAAAIASHLGWARIEGDDFHSPANREKMRNGTALTDDDRSGWLASLCETLQTHNEGAVLTCSALKRSYRNKLRASSSQLGFVFLEISESTALERVTSRAGGHLFPPSLVASQFADLELPTGEPFVLTLKATLPLAALTEHSLRWLEQRNVKAEEST